MIGVAPKGFNGVDLEPVDLFLPIHAFTTFNGSDEWVSHRGWYWLQTLARVAPSASREAVEPRSHGSTQERAAGVHRAGTVLRTMPASSWDLSKRPWAPMHQRKSRCLDGS